MENYREKGREEEKRRRGRREGRQRREGERKEGGKDGGKASKRKGLSARRKSKILAGRSGQNRKEKRKQYNKDKHERKERGR